MKMFRILLNLNILLIHFMKMVNSFYGWCSTTDTFCLYTEDVEYKVVNLSGADIRCKVINDRGKPVEVESERVEKVFEEFAQNYSLTNVILNATNFNSEVLNNSNFITKDDKLIYKNDDSQSYYSVVCMTECKANWIDYNNTRLTSNSINFKNIKTTNRCKDACESSSNCSSIDWNPGEQYHGCWLHFYPYNISDIEDVNDISHHVIYRTSKSIESCISSKESSNANGNLIAILVPIILISIVLITSIIVSIVIFRRRRNKNDDNSTDFEAYKSENHTGDDQSEIDKNSKQINPFKLQNKNSYVNVELDDKEPKRYLGPSGDKYTEVEIDR